MVINTFPAMFFRGKAPNSRESLEFSLLSPKTKYSSLLSVSEISPFVTEYGLR